MNPNGKRNVAIFLTKKAKAEGLPRNEVNPMNRNGGMSFPTAAPKFQNTAPVIRFRQLKQKLLKPLKPNG